MSEKKRKRKKHRAVIPYITTPLIYLAASMIIVVPMCLVALNYAVNLVHKAQPSFSYSISDIELNSDGFVPSTQNSGTVKRPELKVGDKAAQLSCAETGLSCDVFFGRNRASFRQGAGMKTDILPGDTGVCELYGYRADTFKSLKNLKIGDKLKLETSWGTFIYSVSDITTATEPPADTMNQSLLLVTESDDTAFSYLNDESLYVLADIESGPQLEEVQK